MEPVYIRDPDLAISKQTWKDPVPVILASGSLSIGDVTLAGQVEIKDASGNLLEIPSASALKDGANHVALVQNVDDQGAVLRRSDLVDIDFNTAAANVILLATNDKLDAIYGTGTQSLSIQNQQLTALYTLQTLISALRPSIVVTAAEAISPYLPITANGSVANSSDLSTFGKVLGISSTAANAGQPFEVVVSGEVVNLAWSWSVGQSIFVSVKSLAGTAASVGYVQQVGIAKNSTTVVVNVQQPVQI